MIKLLLSLLFLNAVSAMEEENKPTHQTLQVLDIKDYDNCLKSRNNLNESDANQNCLSLDDFKKTDISNYISYDDFLVIHPSPELSRVFVDRSIEQYFQYIEENKKPAILIIACGHKDTSSPYSSSSCEHSKDYFTIDIRRDTDPDVVGDVFSATSYIFQKKKWDFVLFEGLQLHTKDQYNGKSFAELAGIIKESLKPGGAWVIQQGSRFFPNSIKFGNIEINIGSASEINRSPDVKNSIMRTICKEYFGNDSEDFSFENPASLKIAVTKYFEQFGFGGAELRMNLSLDDLNFVSFEDSKLTSENPLSEGELLKINKALGINLYNDKAYNEEMDNLRNSGEKIEKYSHENANYSYKSNAEYIYKNLDKLIVEELINTKNLSVLSSSLIVVKR